MSTERVRYAQVRRNKNGTERHYWIRSGYPNVRLPDDRAKRIALVDRLNDQADRDKAKKGDTQSGEVDWLIQRYRDSDRYAAWHRRAGACTSDGSAGFTTCGERCRSAG